MGEDKQNLLNMKFWIGSYPAVKSFFIGAQKNHLIEMQEYIFEIKE